ncbi:YfjP family GTPase [Sphaerisporangium sp. NPDC005288]|uniref:YfjP family GTPase n=1 Tax=Sphaerisporangium sp. NPDC005288 TaxID=3155114 RepID=UPI0033AC26E0
MKVLRRPKSVPLDDRLAALAEAAELAEGRLQAAAVARAAGVVARAGTRRSLSVEHTVVALAGATGSGKSSLFNALSGTSLATVGVTRPTTSTAQAAMWDPEGAGPLLDWLEVPRRHTVGEDGGMDGTLSGLVLLDLPDHDSIEAAHRLEVDRLVSVVDLLVWVLDPQKYADAAVHERYLRPLRRHRDVMLIVLNQVDRLSPPAAERCVRDLRRLLEEDGLSGVPVVATSVREGRGVAELRSALARRVADRHAWTARLEADVRQAADVLAAASSGVLTAGVPTDGASSSGVLTDGASSSGIPTDGASSSGVLTAGASSGVLTAGVPAEAASPPGEPETWAEASRALERRAEAAEKALPDELSRPLTAALAEAAGVPTVVEAVRKAHRHRSVAATGWPVTRWLRRLRPDPLRRLHLGGASAAAGGRTSIPAASGVQRSRMETAIRDVGSAASADLPEPWAVVVRGAARSRADDLAETLDRAVATTSMGAGRRPRWWRAVGVLQWLVFTAMLAGALWLFALFVMDYLRFPEVPTPTLDTVPWPTVLLVGGVLAGLLIALLSRAAAAVGGARRARKARRALWGGVDQVGRELVLDPVRDELHRARRFAELLTTARG